MQTTLGVKLKDMGGFISQAMYVGTECRDIKEVIRRIVLNIPVCLKMFPVSTVSKAYAVSKLNLHVPLERHSSKTMSQDGLKTGITLECKHKINQNLKERENQTTDKMYDNVYKLLFLLEEKNRPILASKQNYMYEDIVLLVSKHKY